MRYEGKNWICRDSSGKEVRRPNKVAVHYSRKRNLLRSDRKPELLTLAVRGTLDTLARFRFEVIRVTLPHPTDFGYFKTSYILKKNKHKFNTI